MKAKLIRRIAGQVIGNWELLSKLPIQDKWEVKCICGVKREAYISNLINGRPLSCGCLKPALSPWKSRPTYNSWNHAKERCYNPKDNAYPNYGGRGITMCDRWLNSFHAFLEDMGEKPEGLTLDRINNNGNYEPANCRWATQTEQANNRRSNVAVGDYKTMTEAANTIGLSYSALKDRVNSGWEIEKILTTPSRPKTRKIQGYSSIIEAAQRTGIPESILRGRLSRGWSEERALTTPIGNQGKRKPNPTHPTTGETP
jgi:hypothetical protein